MRFAPEYVACVLNENFEDAKALFLAPLMAIHYAHLVMLAEQGIVGRADGRPSWPALDAISASRRPAGPLRRLVRGPVLLRRAADRRGCGGGRGRPAAHRAVAQRHRHDDVPDAAAGVDPRRCSRARCGCGEVLLDLADRHREDVFPAHTHTQPAQPTTIAHYLLAVVEQLERDARPAACRVRQHEPQPARRLRDHRHRVSHRPPRGPATCSGSTARPATPTAASPRSTTCSRACRRRGAARRPRPGRAGSPALVHGGVRLPAAGRRLRAVQQHHAAEAQSRGARARARDRQQGARPGVGDRCSTVHNTPFGDIVDTEDDLQPLVVLDVQRRERARCGWWPRRWRRRRSTLRGWPSAPSEGWITVTELADTLTRDHGVPFKTSHADRLAARGRVGSAAPDDLCAPLAARDLRRASAAEPIRYSPERARARS